jgi:hypothetical protein
LKVRTGVTNSSFSHSSLPSRWDKRGAKTNGVGGKNRRTTGNAASTSARLTGGKGRRDRCALSGIDP